MGFRDWPSWVKGGIILLILSLIIQFYYLYNVKICIDPADGADLDNPTFGCKSILERLFIDSQQAKFILLLIFFPVISFIIGAVIGWIVGKIRNRNQNLR